MKPELSPRNVNLALVVLLILVMCSQLGFIVPLGGGLPVTVADVLVALAFVGIALRLVSTRFRGIKPPPLQGLALVAIALIALARTRPITFAAIKEPLQLAEYFIFAFFVFSNVAETRDLKLLLTAFAVATAAVVIWAGYHYLACDSPLDVRAGYGNRNLLGAFLAIALPMLYGLAVHIRSWRWRLVLLAIVALGLFVNLSGAAVLVTLVVLGLLSALRGQRALVPFAIVLAIALLFVPRVLRPHHADAVFSSVAVNVDDNYLLSDRALVARARELLHPTHEIIADHSGERVMPPSRPLDALRLLNLLNARRPLKGEDEFGLFVEVNRTIATAVSQAQLAAYPLNDPQLAVRYQRWGAALAAIRSLWQKPLDALFGKGLVPYHKVVNPFMTQRLQYRTDEPEVYNVAAPEPFTHNLWLKTLLLTGLAGFLVLAWLVGSFLHRSARLYREAHSELILGVALGAIGGILGFTLAGIFTETIVRGLAIPFVFVLATVAIAERIVHGDPQSALEQLTRHD